MMDSIWELSAYLAGTLLAMMTVGWVVATVRRNVGLIDGFWGLGFVVAAMVTFLVTDGQGHDGRRLTVLVAVTLWGGRLALHLFRRNWSEAEDWRYAAMRAKRPKTFVVRSLFTIFYFQAAVLWVVAWPIMASMWHTAAWPNALDYVAGAMFLIGFLFETVGDWQLARFKCKRKTPDAILDHGLWRYTRHPNYFGDACVMWSLYLAAIATGAGYATVFAPIIMTILLRFFTGVGLTEKRLMETKPGFREYVRRTNAFFPWFPRRAKD